MRGISISLHSAGGKFMSSLTRASITPSICPSAIPIEKQEQFNYIIIIDVITQYSYLCISKGNSTR